jgi:hypothetical protein
MPSTGLPAPNAPVEDWFFMMTSVCLPSVPFRTTVSLRTILSDMCGDCERLLSPACASALPSAHFGGGACVARHGGLIVESSR